MSCLFLFSSGKFVVSGILDQYLPRPMTEYKIAYITTASKKVFDISYIEERREAMKDLGRDYEEIDFAEENETSLKQKLWMKDVVFVEGGNTFYLLKYARESWFTNIIWWLLEDGLIYIWSSAGTYLATPSILSATKSNQGYDQCGVTDFTGLGLFPFMIKVHYTEAKYEHMKELWDMLHLPVYGIHNQQAILYKDEKIVYIGEGEPLVYHEGSGKL